MGASVFVPIFGGPNYVASIPILRWLCVAQGLGIVLTPLMLALYPLRRVGLIVFLNAAQLYAQVGLGAWLAPEYKLDGAAWAMTGAKCIVAVPTILLFAWAFRQRDAKQTAA